VTMRIVGGTLSRYFGMRFLNAVLLVFLGIFGLVALLDYIEMMRRAGDVPNVSALLVFKTSLYRVPQVTERIMPFCILIGAMSCYLNLSRRLELVVARAAGMSAWQFISPALVVAFLFGVFATTVYNPVSAVLQERSKRFEAELFGSNPDAVMQGNRLWLSQRSSEGQALINANTSRGQGVALNGVTIFNYDMAGHFKTRIEARSAELTLGEWVLQDARVFQVGTLPQLPRVSTQDQPDARTGSRKLCKPPKPSHFGTAAVYQDCRARWTAGFRL